MSIPIMKLCSVICILRLNPSPDRPVLDRIYLPRRDGRLSWPVDWVHTEMVYIICPQTVTHPTNNRARCRATSLMEYNALTTSPGCSGVDKGEWWGLKPPPVTPGLGPWFCQYAMEFLGTQMSTNTNLLSPDVFFSSSKCTKTHFWPAGGAYDAPPRPPSRLGRETPPPHSTPSRRLNLAGASFVTPLPNKFLPMPLAYPVFSGGSVCSLSKNNQNNLHPILYKPLFL